MVPRNELSLKRVVSLAAFSIVLVGILAPVWAAAGAGQDTGMKNSKILVLGVLAYAADHDEVTPQIDNTGDCLYGDVPCAMPDWGNAGNPFPTARPMFMHVIRSYTPLFDRAIYSTVLGKTNWEQAVAQSAAMGINFGGPYDPSREDLYYGIVSFYAPNIITVDRWGLNGLLAGVTDPADTVLLSTSVWGATLEAELKVGDGGVWPNMPGTPCFQWGTGWTWYHLGATAQSGSVQIIQSGKADVAYTDGHTAVVTYPENEACVFEPTANIWVYDHFDYRY